MAGGDRCQRRARVSGRASGRGVNERHRQRPTVTLPPPPATELFVDVCASDSREARHHVRAPSRSWTEEYEQLTVNTRVGEAESRSSAGGWARHELQLDTDTSTIGGIVVNGAHCEPLPAGGAQCREHVALRGVYRC